MTTSNRATLIQKTHKVLKKHFKPITSLSDRPLLENLVYAHCLENARYVDADNAFARLESSFFDWNEIRVTTVPELAEVMDGLSDPAAAASNIKRTLQGVFESTYSFDLESLKKQNIGKTVKQLRDFEGVTEFAIAYVTQHSLGGHAIPVDKGALDTLYIVGVIDEAERVKAIAPGLERAIPKKKGVEYASLLHQLAAELVAAPHKPETRAILLEIAPDAQPRLPKRTARKKSTARAKTKRSPRADASTDDENAKRSSTKEKTGRAAKSRDASNQESQTAASRKTSAKQLAKRKPR